MAKYDERGREIPDRTPIEVPLHLRTPEDETIKMARMVTQELSRQSNTKGFESEQEAHDFDIEDDEDIFPTSNFEVHEMTEEYLPQEPMAPETEETEDGTKEADATSQENERKETDQ